MASGDDSYQYSISKNLIEKSQRELKEKPEWVSRDIQALREMVLGHKGLHCRTDDRYLLRFLRARKFDYDRAFNLLLRYFSMRAENQELFQDLKPSSLQLAINTGVSIRLPLKDPEGRCLLYFRPANWDPSVFSIYDILRLTLVNLEVTIEEEENQINGFVVIGNFQNLGWNHAKNMEKNYAQLMSKVLQDAFPARFKAMHIVHEPMFLSYLFAVIKPFLREKLTSRLFFHGSDLSELYKSVPPDYLPEELGGELPHGDELAKVWQSILASKEGMFDEMLQHHIDSPHSVVSSKGDETFNCFYGTYRKLNIDY